MTADPGRAYRALLIGNSEFPGDPDHLRILLGPPVDVPLLAEALTDPETGLHQADAVKTVLEETNQRIRDELEEFFDSALPHEQLFLYYSGHGLLDLRNRLRLCARDTTTGRLQARSVELEFINGLIDGCAARSTVVVLDCCFSGAAAVKGQDPAAKLAGRGRFVMTSSGQADTSADARKAGAASPFTRYLVTGLRSGAPGRGGYATAYDVYQYVHGRLRESGQTPHMKTEAGAGTIPLARRPVWPADTTADGPVRANDDAAPFDVRPVLTHPDGNRARLATYTDLSGVLHVRLPRLNAILTTHRDEIAGASEGTPVTAELYSFADIARSDVRARAQRFKEEDLRADTSDGGVSFVLSHNAGTVEWQKSQVRAFRQADSQGRWPGTPRSQSPRLQAYKADGGYRRLRSAARRGLLWSSALIPEAMALNALTGSTWYGRVGGMALTLAFVVSLIQALRQLRNVWMFLRIRNVLQNSGLYAIPMVMETGTTKELVMGGGGMGFGSEVDYKPWAWLRYEGTPLVPPSAQDELSGASLEEEEAEWPALSVPLQSFHRGDIAQRADSPDTPGIEHVKVIGAPRPGRWVVIHTANGMLWPCAKAQ
ncbi:caspase domain-containing protein [Streptomyces sp. NPDC052042]|uniref:caspase domain-containing protein n=1 Tax=Streptomyces sp. NPDC052042 TaxID=3365683 RepID=UPI0037D7BFEA